MSRRTQPHYMWNARPSFLASEHVLARYLGRPLADFLRVETAGSVILLAAALIAILWANSPWESWYAAVWHTPAKISIAGWTTSEDLKHWVNNGLMTVFFFVVGLEIKTELVQGHLSNRRAAITPVLAAGGGMLVPAAIYLAVGHGPSGASGWGIPMATDIAFAVGVLGLLGRRVPPAARIFLLTLAIADDIGAILVIAVFYASSIAWGWLALAVTIFATAHEMQRLRVWSVPVYAVLGVAAWLATYQSGIHATVAGVALGLLTPATPLLREREARRAASGALQRHEFTMDDLVRLRFLLDESVPVATRLQAKLHPLSSYVVLPVFAMANAGVAIDAGSLGRALSSHVTIGVVLGLVVGKVVGITVVTWLAVRTKIGRLPAGTNWSMLAGVGLIAGVGFTVALLVAELSFPGQARQLEAAKIGILASSVCSAAAGLTLIRLTTERLDSGGDAAPLPTLEAHGLDAAPDPGTVTVDSGA